MQPAGKWKRTYKSCVHRDGPFGYRHYTMVYAIDAPDIGRVKFGKTSNIDKRFRGICNMSPCQLVLLGYCWLPDELEAYIFDFLKDDRCHGEWFLRTEKVRSIAALVAAGGCVELAEVLGIGYLLQNIYQPGRTWKFSC